MFVESRFKFALECLKQCMLIEPRSSVFFSPPLIYEHLLIVYILCNDGIPTSDKIKNSLRQSLYIPVNVTKTDVQHYYLEHLEKFNYWVIESTKTYSYGIHNTIWIENKLMARKRGFFRRHLNMSVSNLFWFKYRRLCKVQFDNSLYSTDRRNEINTRINSTTNNLIQNLLPPNTIHDKTNLVMANAAYFQGKINREVDPNAGAGHSKSVEGTNLQLNANITQLRFKNGWISIFFFTPELSESEKDNIILTNDRIIKMINQLMTEEGFQYLRQILNYGVPQQTCTFPTFKIVQDLRMYNLLEMLDVPELTPVGATNVNQMTYLGAVKFGDAMHRVSIDITENSVTAAASNVLFSSNSSRRERINTVDCSNSCVCFIYDKYNSNILYCGVLFKDESQQQCRDAADISECCSALERL